MRLVLLGPPGAGKGTQAAAVRERYGVPHVSTGEMLREAIAAGTALGTRVKEIVDSGSLVPDGIVGEVVADRLGRDDTGGGYLLDGFPRTLQQAEILNKVLEMRQESLDAVVRIRLDDDEVVRRLSGRRTCASCGAPCHLVFSRPRVAGICDACGGELRQRDDDHEDVIRKRLAVYREQTVPLAAHYRALGLLKDVDGQGPVREVTRRIFDALDAAEDA